MLFCCSALGRIGPNRATPAFFFTSALRGNPATGEQASQPPLRDDVMEATAGRQEPYTYGSLPGKEDFFFVAK
jgi:hypothetical protein